MVDYDDMPQGTIYDFSTRKWMTPQQQAAQRSEASLKKGGKIHKTGTYKLHKGERVLNAAETKRHDMKKDGGETVGRKSTNQNRKFLSASSAKYQNREMFGRGATKKKHGREVKANGINGS
jgi:hypothetical protein